jgi:hypothetical protein
MRVGAARFFVIPSEAEGPRGITHRLLHGISRLRFAPLGMTPNEL